jgi:hypothetical protein
MSHYMCANDSVKQVEIHTLSRSVIVVLVPATKNNKSTVSESFAT